MLADSLERRRCEAATSPWVRVLATTTTRSPSRVGVCFPVECSSRAGSAHGTVAEVAGGAPADRGLVQRGGVTGGRE